MVVASIVLAILNVMVLAAFAFVINQIRDDILAVVHDAVETEVRRQDQRLEKRMQRAAEPEEDPLETEPGQVVTVVAGRPMR